MRWIWATILLAVGAAAWAQMPSDDLSKKQIAMLHAEAQFFAALAEAQKGELDKLKAAPPDCKDK